MDVLKNALVGISLLTGILIAALIPEITSLPSLKTTLASVTGIPYSISTFFIFSLIVPFPMLTILLILSTFKKFVFNHTKNIANSFTRALYTLAISYGIAVALVTITFVIDLAFKSDYYIIIRLAGIIRDNGNAHVFTMSLLMALLAQATTFCVAFLITETVLTYKFKVVSTTARTFIFRNYVVLLAVALEVIVNVTVMCKIEEGYNKRYVTDFYNIKNHGVTDRLAEAALVTVILMYLYALLTIHEN